VSGFPLLDSAGSARRVSRSIYDPMVGVRTALTQFSTGMTAKQLTGAFDPMVGVRTALTQFSTGMTAKQLTGIVLDTASRLASSEYGEVETAGEMDPDLVGWIAFAFVVVLLLTFWLNDMNAGGISVEDVSRWDLLTAGGFILSTAWFARSVSRSGARRWNRGLGG